MGATVSANMRTVVHKTSNGMLTSFPDTCKTPTPGGPVPIPYPNIAMSKDTQKGTTTVKCDGNPINVKDSIWMMSQGDEAGAAMGVLSSRIKGKADWINAAQNVKANGKNVCRLGDPMRSNAGSSENTPPIPEFQDPFPGLAATEERLKACEALRKKQLTRDQAQERSGQTPEHFDANCQTAADTDTALAFRDSNPASQPHIYNGNPPKPVGFPGNTGRGGGSFADGVASDGLVVDTSTNMPHLIDDLPVTGDYDLHDMVSIPGGSVPGGSAREESMIQSLNENLNDALPEGSQDMVQHGAWTEWDEVQAGNQPPTSLPATVTTPDGEFFALDTPEDHENFRKCAGA